jgi:hypothetical protein
MGTVGNSALWGMIGLNMAWITGMIGGIAFDPGDDAQKLLYSLAAMGGSMGAAVLAARHVRAGRDLAAGGFVLIVVISIAETVAGFGGAGADSVFTQLSILFLPALWLVAFQDWSTAWARGAAALSGLAFAVYGYTYTLGDSAPDSDSPVLIVAYLLFTIAIIGWTMTLRSEAE